MLKGACHCGAVKFEMMESPKSVTDCNCTICRRLGTLWAYGNAANIKLKMQEGATLSYIWGDRFCAFHSCKTCGCTTHWISTSGSGESQRLAVNARLAEPAEIRHLPVQHFDGLNSFEDFEVRNVATVTVVVDDYDIAKKYFTEVLKFIVVEDTALEDGKRWLVVKAFENAPLKILLAKAANPAQQNAIGNQTGGRVFLFLETDDFTRDYERFSAAGVEFIETPRAEAYGRVVKFKDYLGNLWDLIERSPN